jgi:hypothetical protein
MNLLEKIKQALQIEQALDRHQQHEDDAEDLKRAQKLEALRLHDSQHQGFGKDVVRVQKSAAYMLEQSQKDSANALKAAHEDHEARLKGFQESERKELSAKNQLISWLTGGYSVSDNENQDMQ